MTQVKPTIDELEALLNSDDGTPVTINTDGSIIVGTSVDNRPCSCPLGERPEPCERKHALSACRATVMLRRLSASDREMIFEVFPDERFTLMMALERIA